MIRTRRRQPAEIITWHGRHRGGRWLHPQHLVTVRTEASDSFAWAPSLRADRHMEEIEDAIAEADVKILTGGELEQATTIAD